MAAPRDTPGGPASGRRLLVCTGPCCDRNGHASAHLADLRALLLARGLGPAGVGSAACVRRSCLGKCTGEPLAHVVPDDVWYVSLSDASLLRIYDQHVVGGEPVAQLVASEPV
jgi:(2Fe-2S) ferredoxin